MANRNSTSGRYDAKLLGGKGKFFIIGLRRSGTSIFRTLVSKSPAISTILFEPHELFYAAQLLKISRYKSSKYHIKAVASFNSLPKWSGAKFALNPGIDALEWVWFHKIFPHARFLFIKRNCDSNWKSYQKADGKTLRGIIPQEIYTPFHAFMNSSFSSFHKANPTISTIINYDKMLSNADKEMQKVWDILKVKSPGSLKSMIKQPRN